MGSEWNSPSSVTVVMNWLTWKRNNPIHGLQKAIDLLNKTFERSEQEEKFHLEKAAMYFEIAKQQYRANNKRGALSYIKLKVKMEETAQRCRDCQLLLHKELMLTEHRKKKLIWDERVEKKKKQLIEALLLKPTHVFVCFCSFLIMLTFI
ncbi:predicted protein [Arabidopsis lyrata subsp. lyrata]|uniref:Predicted protein n=1 Tax=Arabidopsis lyrata subsp. lyrata TaxID=81972 RepID=D7KFT6_ARALL|nr:uncharacterized protein LOC9327605 [Arabidopsis lyrata subsp. lyrata]EFH67802.1 predicted protein [Arabidopsis lyrata subsp. lyrata]|eukprot:XP_002891543.1 uncharacterized protein LOC9327605 [Arabidopsis lyrata subsp. lyrata]